MRRTVSSADLGALLIYATRYALGRVSTAPSTMSVLIQAYISGISDADLGVLLRDILEWPTQQYDCRGGLAHTRPEAILGDDRYGHRCDRQDWRVAAEAILAEQQRRAEAA